MTGRTILTLILVVIAIGGAGSTLRHHVRQVSKSVKPADGDHRARYLPLGDSYTIGQSVPESQNFPSQLADQLGRDGRPVIIVANPAVTGYTTQNVIDSELPLIPKFKPTFVTLLIGVNDYVQGVSIQTFEANLEHIVGDIQGQLPDRRNLVLITVPDFGKTPAGQQFGDPAELAAGVLSFNDVIKKIAAVHGLAVADIFAVSQGVTGDSGLTAGDGLHPSPAEYGRWLEIIYPVVKQTVRF